MDLMQWNVDIERWWRVERRLPDVLNDADDLNGSWALIVVADQQALADGIAGDEPISESITHQSYCRCVAPIGLCKGSPAQQPRANGGQVPGRDRAQVRV